MRKIALAILAITSLFVAGCNDANVVSNNLSTDADNFKILRRVVFYNGITNDYILTIQGYCSQLPAENQKKLAVVCRDNNGGFKKHFLGLSDNVTYFSEQLDTRSVSASFYKVVFKPLTIIPDIEIR